MTQAPDVQDESALDESAREVGPEAEPGDDRDSPEFRYRRLLEVTCRLNQEHDLEELLRYLTEQAAELTFAERASIFLADEYRDELRSQVAMQVSEPVRLRPGEGIAGFVYETCRPIVLDDAYADPRFNPEVDRRTGFRTRSLLCVPIRHLFRKPVGVFEVLNKKRGGFVEADVALLTGLGTHAAVALDQARAWTEREGAMDRLLDAKRELTRRVEQLGILYELESASNREPEVDSFLEAVMAKLVEAFDSEAGSILLPTERRGVLYFFASAGGHQQKLRAISLQPGEGIASWCHEHGQVVVSNDLDHDPRFSRRIDELVGFRTQSILCVPIRFGDRNLGAIELCNGRHGGYSEDDLRAVELIAVQLAELLARKVEKEERARRSRLEDLGSLVQGIAHDLRVPLNNVLNSAELLRMREPDVEFARWIASLLDRQARRCLSLTEDILDYSKGTFTYEMSTVTVKALFDDLAEAVQSELETRRILLEREAAEELAVRADQLRISRVLTNLATNAARAIGVDGVIRLGSRRIDGAVVLSVSDNGPGVDDNLRPLLFEPFVSGSGSTGLGLALARRIVEDHSGKIRLDEKHSPGARFEVVLPLAPQEDGEPTEKEPAGVTAG